MTIQLLNASGCLDPLAAPDVARSLDVVVTKTITPLPRAGNPPVRIAETEHGMVNSIGLQGPGIEAFVEESLPRLAGLGVPLWVSVGGFSADDYALCCARLDGDDRIAAIELNLSCPNVEEAPETAADLDHDAILAAILGRLGHTLDALGRDDPALAARWANLDTLRDRPVRIDQGGGRLVTGIGAGITADGGLAVATASGLVTLRGGTVLRGW